MHAYTINMHKITLNMHKLVLLQLVPHSFAHVDRLSQDALSLIVNRVLKFHAKWCGKLV